MWPVEEYKEGECMKHLKHFIGQPQDGEHYVCLLATGQNQSNDTPRCKEPGKCSLNVHQGEEVLIYELFGLF